MSTMGERIRLIREELRLKQEEFANHFGVSRAFISAIEKDKNKFSVDNLCKLLVDFDVNINYVLAGKGNMFNNMKEQPKEEEMKKWFNDMIREEFKKRGL